MYLGTVNAVNIMIELNKITVIKKQAGSTTCKLGLSLKSQGLVSRHIEEEYLWHELLGNVVVFFIISQT